MPPTDSPPIAGPVLIEDDDETIYNPITPTPDAVVEHLEDSLTIPDDDSSDVVTVYDDCDSLTMEKPLADTSSRVNHQIPIEVSVDITLPSTAENLNNSDAVKELLDKMKEPLSNLDKEWISLHQQLNHLPHSEMMRLVKAGFLDKKFLKVNKLRCPHCIIATQARTRSRYKPSKNQEKSHIRQKHHDVPGACVSTDQLVSAVPGIIQKALSKPQ